MRALLFFLLLSSTSAAQTSEAKLNITQLSGDFYIYTTYNMYKEYRIPANGMYVVTDDGVVLFDTPWDTTQFQTLLDSIDLRHQKKVVMCLATHWHSDRTEGLEYYEQQGIKTYTTALTDQFSKQHNKKRAANLIASDTTFNFGHYQFETYYPGEGHTADNIVVWFEKEKILYGGCLIKGAKSKDLGNMEDANAKAYCTTLLNVQKKYKKPKFIVVSHSDWKSKRSLKHSIKLARKLSI